MWPATNKSVSLIFVSMLALLLAGCDSGNSQTGTSAQQTAQQSVKQTTGDASDRWYSEAQASAGEQVFAQNCAVCHGANAEGTVADWRQRLDDGSLPPPPLNGSAHAWHHPRAVLVQVINTGGAPYGGNMPPFDEVLAVEEKLAAIAYFQSFWDEEIYEQWAQIDGSN